MTSINMKNSTDLSFTSNISPLTDSQFLPSCNKTTTIRVGTLNCRSIVKTNHPTNRQEFIRFLRLQNFDILALQETHATTPELQLMLNQFFRTDSTTWSAHCGTVCFNPNLQLHPNFISIDGRVISCFIHHINQVFDPIEIISKYEPADRISSRRNFFRYLLHVLHLLGAPFSTIEDSSYIASHNTSRKLIMGDFNYAIRDITNLDRRTLDQQDAQSQWHNSLQQLYRNWFDNMPNLPTFRRG